MRYIDKTKSEIQKAANLHVENVKKWIDRKEEKEQIYRCLRILYEDKEDISYTEDETVLHKWLEEFLLADLEKLRKMAAAYRPEMKRPFFKDMYKNTFRDGNKASKEKYCAAKMVSMLDIRVCPYCDRNFINNVRRKKDGKVLRGNQLDHFFPQNRYPMLAMCFYNLIPVCAGCNLRKHEKEFSMNPYESGIEEQTFFDVDVKQKNSKIYEQDVEVKLMYTSAIRKNIEILALEEEYAQCKDIACEIVTKAIFYDETKKRELCRNYPELFSTLADVDRILYGMDFENTGRRPFQKFYKDLLKIYYREMDR